MFPIPLSPQSLENTAIYTVFFNFSMFQCRWPTQTHIHKILQKHCFFNVFTFCSVKNTVSYTFFGIKSVQNIGFCSVFNALAAKNHSKYRYLQCDFICVRFSTAGSLPKWPKIPFQYPLKLRHPKIVEKTRKHHQYQVSVRNRFWAPPPPSWSWYSDCYINKCDWAFSVAVCTPISTPSPPKRCGRI